MLIEIILVVLTLFLLLYRFVTKNFDYWEKQGVTQIKGHFPYGSYKEIVTQAKHFNQLIQENYEKFKGEDFVGIFLLGKPVLIVQNIDMIRNVMAKDFNHFVDRNCASIGQWSSGGDLDQLWAQGMTELLGDEWKDVRSAFTPIFTSGKMKGMLKMIAEIGKAMKKNFEKYADSGQDFELKEEFGKFSLDSLAACAFGLNPKSYEEGSGIFVRSAAAVFEISMVENLKLLTRFIPGSAWLQQKLKIDVFKPKETKFFRDIILKTIKHRRKTGERANDLIDLMLDCMKSSDNVEVVENEQADDSKLKNHKRSKELTEDIIVSNCLVFLIAGYDTTGMTLGSVGYYLSKYPEVQAKLQDEVDQAYEASGGSLPDYTVIQELPYLEMCIMEALRKITPVGGIIRACTKDYTFPNTNITVKHDDLVIIPASGLHNDPQFYPNPKEFNPENFSKEAKAGRSPYAFQGFGQGPRQCIGMRFALLEAKVALMEVMNSFSFIYSDKNPEVLQIDPNSQLGYVKGGLYAKIQRR